MSASLAFSQVSFSYLGQRGLANTSFSIPPGACAALIGPNGIGKTTLLRLAARILPCSSGHITVNRRDLKDFSRVEVARSIALVPQSLDMPFPFTVEEIVRQGRTPYLGLLGRMSTRDHEAVEQAMEATGIACLRHRIFNQLSGGERQRVKIALGLAQQPRLLLLDEPTQSLDIGRQWEIIELIGSLNRSGVTILAAMHDLGVIERAFSIVLLLSPQAPLAAGSPAEILQPKTLERAFNCPPQSAASFRATTERTVSRYTAV